MRLRGNYLMSQSLEINYLQFVFLEAYITYEIVAAFAFHSKEIVDFSAFGINFLKICQVRNIYQCSIISLKSKRFVNLLRCKWYLVSQSYSFGTKNLDVETSLRKQFHLQPLDFSTLTKIFIQYSVLTAQFFLGMFYTIHKKYTLKT